MISITQYQREDTESQASQPTVPMVGREDGIEHIDMMGAINAKAELMEKKFSS